MAADDTLLVLTGMGVAPYSARGLKFKLEPIAATQQQERNVNGGLIDFSAPQMRKYKITITCDSDMNAPALDGIWPGSLITIESPAEIPFETGTNARPAVPGSIRTEEGFTFYRPILEAMVMNFSAEEDEYNRVVSWELDAEEV